MSATHRTPNDHAVGVLRAYCAEHPAPEQPLASVAASTHFHAATVYTGPRDDDQLAAVLAAQREIVPATCYECGSRVTTQTATAAWPPGQRDAGDTAGRGEVEAARVREALAALGGYAAVEVTAVPPRVAPGRVGGAVTDTVDGAEQAGVVIGVFNGEFVVGPRLDADDAQHGECVTVDAAVVEECLTAAHAVEFVATRQTALAPVLRAAEKGAPRTALTQRRR